MSVRAIAKTVGAAKSSVAEWLSEPEGDEEVEVATVAESRSDEDTVAALLLEKAQEIAQLLPHGLTDKDNVPMVQQGAAAVARLVEKYLALTGRPGDGPQPPGGKEDPKLDALIAKFFTAKPNEAAKAPGS